jgi:heptosyltransferase II
MADHPPSSTLHPRRILVRGVNWLGDAVMTTPALMRLREKFPDTHITILCPEKLYDLWLEHPAVNDVATFAAGEGLFTIAERLKAWTFLKGLKAGIAAYKEETDRLSAKVRNETIGGVTLPDTDPIKVRPFDLALVLPNSPRSALEVFLARIPQRIGYARPWRSFFLTQAVAPRAGAVKMHKRTTAEIKTLIATPDHASRITYSSRHSATKADHASSHQIHEYLHLVAALGANPEPLAPLLYVTLEEIAVTKKKFGLEDTPGPILGLNPGAEYGPAKRWPVNRFIAAALAIQKQTNCTWLLFGGKQDEVIANQIQSAIGTARPTFGRQSAINLAGKTTLRELMALLKSCDVLLTNDTGPMHVAAALGTPVVVPFGSTSPELTGPALPGDPRHFLLKSDAPCSPCFLRECPIDFRCMNGIGVERVVEAVIEALKC